jgi:predicted DNA-binding transcriptional regulator AlpA
MGRLLTAADVEAKTTIAAATLYAWRSKKKAGVPLGFKLAGRVVWDEADVDAWIAAQQHAGDAS